MTFLDHKCGPGVYKIEHVSGKFYIGSSVNLSKRWSQHRRELRKGIHDNIHLQRAWNKYGETAFLFTVVESCELAILLAREQFYLDTLRPAYNIGKIAGAAGMGRRPSKETRQKMRASNTGKKHPPRSFEWRQSVSQRMIGTTYHTTPHTTETKLKISAAKKGRPWTEARRIAQENRGALRTF